MSESEVNQTKPALQERRELPRRQPKQSTRDKELTDSSKNMKNPNKTNSKEILALLKKQEVILKTIMKKLERESKEVGNLETRMKKVEHSIEDMEENLSKTITFIHNRGWKKKKR